MRRSPPARSQSRSGCSRKAVSRTARFAVRVEISIAASHYNRPVNPFEETTSTSPAADALGPDGPFAASSGFAPRDVQQAMAAAVEKAIADRGELVVEAGTGTG